MMEVGLNIKVVRLSSEERREAIKGEAMRLFVDRGMSVGLRDIAAACDMSTPNFYAHFASKEALVEEMFQEGYAIYAAAIIAASPSAYSFEKRLECVIYAVCALHDEDPVLFSFLLLSQHNVLASVEREGNKNPVHLLQGLITAGMDEGAITHRDANLVTAMMLGIMLQTATFLPYRRLDGGMLELSEEIVAACKRVIA